MISIEDGMAVLNKGRLEVFVYQKYFGKLAEISGEVVKSIGLLPYYWYAKWDDTKPAKIGTLKLPCIGEFHPDSIDIGTKVKVYPESDEKEYTKLTFMEKDRCWSNLLIKTANCPIDFTDALFAAQLDTNIPYNLLVPYWEAIGLKNGVNFGVSGPAMEIVIRQLCRYKKDRNILYSQILEKNPKIGQVSYQFMNSRDLCAVSGVFPSISFEDMNSMIDNSINITNKGLPQQHSPIEDIIYL